MSGFIIKFFNVQDFGLHVCLCTKYNLVPLVARRNFLELVTDYCEPPHRYWKSNLGHLEKQPVILVAEPSLQTHEWL